MSKGSSAPPPDPRLVEGQLRSMGIQDDAITQVLAMARDMQPLQREQMQFGLDSARTAFNQSQDDRVYALERRGELTRIQDRIIADADNFDETSRGNELADRGMADVASQAAVARRGIMQEMGRRGVNPNSGRMEAMQTNMAVGEAAARAGAGAQGRSVARGEGIALADRAASALSGYPGMGMATTQGGANYGTLGTTVANNGLAGMTAPYGQAAGIAGAMGGNATGMYNAQGTYQNQRQQNANNANNGIWGAIGTLAGGFISDSRLKINIVPLGTDARGFEWVEFTYLWGGDRHVGVIAQQVQTILPAAVNDHDGYLSVNYAMLA
jgi:hypothetical protein